MAENAGQRFRVLPGRYAVCRLERGASPPAWARGEFVSVTSTDDEISVVCLAGAVPPDVRAERDWRLLKIIGPLPFTMTGVLASLATPLAQAGIGLMAIATYDTDYVLVKGEALGAALSTLIAAGHTQIE